jgi:predicted RNase H-related nuclease YkuK (DUF458 family)
MLKYLNSKFLKYFLISNNLKITCVAIFENTNSLVVGCSDGRLNNKNSIILIIIFEFKFFSVLFYKGDAVKDTRNLKSRLIHQAPHGITGLAFKEMAKVLVIFVATEFSILTISTGSKDKDEKVFLSNSILINLQYLKFFNIFKRVLSSTDGCNLNCSTITDQLFDHQFIVARKDVFLI